MFGIDSEIVKKILHYRLEIIFISVALIILLSSFIILQSNLGENKEEIEFVPATTKKSPTKDSIAVDISGAVNKPDMYQLPTGARLKDLVDKAGGLSDEADKQFFARNFNLARMLADQDKIYIPNLNETTLGIFQESPKTIEYIRSSYPSYPQAQKIESDAININTATLEELDQLPGIGKITAQKIIDNRPYSSIDELLIKKIVNSSVYSKIQQDIEI